MMRSLSDSVGRMAGTAHEPGRLKRTFQQLTDSSKINRFDEIVKRSVLHGLDRGISRSMSRNEDDGTTGILLSYVIEKVDS